MPHIACVGGDAKSTSSLFFELKRKDVRIFDDVCSLVLSVSSLEKRDYSLFSLHCFTARDFGFSDTANRPTLETLFQYAIQEEYSLATPEIAYRLLLRRTPLLFPGKFCLVSMDPIKWMRATYLPLIQTIRNEESDGVAAVRMVAGDLSATWALDVPVLFVKKVM